MLVVKWLIGSLSLALMLGFVVQLAPAQLQDPGTATTTFTLLHSFNGTDGENPQAGLVQATNGSLYGIAGATGNQWGLVRND